ncbi:MAG: ABC transporter permease [Clostridiales bacterium]|nr:ABC transporter permease [Clostridiales bacterium]
MSEATDTIIREFAGVSVVNSSLRNSDDLFNLPDRLSKEDYYTLKDIEHISDVKMFKYNFHTDFLKNGISPLNIIVQSSSDTPANIEAPIFVIGYNTSLMHLYSEEFSLESGRMFENENECIISKNSKAVDDASINWNDTVLGDTIFVNNDNDVSKSFTVVGILAENTDDDEKTNRRIVYTSLEGAEYFDNIALVDDAGIRGYNLKELSIEDLTDNAFNVEEHLLIPMGYEALAYLDNPEKLLSIQKDINKIEFDGYFISLKPMFSDFSTLINMTGVMSNNAGGFMIITGILLFFVTVIATIMLLGTRKYEIAVLRSIGMKKSRLIISYLIENLIFILGIAAVSLIIAQFISPAFTVPIFNGIQSIVSPDIYKRISGGFGFIGTMMNFGIVFGGASVIVLLSTFLSCIHILKFEPLKIFNKRF